MADYCIELLQRLMHDLSSYRGLRIELLPSSALDSIVVSLEIAYRELMVLDLTEQLSSSQREGAEKVRLCTTVLRDIQNSYQVSRVSRPSIPPSVTSGVVGRPRYEIPEETLVFFLENRFSVPQIASMLAVSVSTIRRRMSAVGLSVRNAYSDISDAELDDLVLGIHQQYPTCGNTQMKGHLVAMGYNIQQIRIRESMRRIDPAGTALRRLYVVNRRQYSVPSPLSLFHIDGHHKLIRYTKIIIIKIINDVSIIHMADGRWSHMDVSMAIVGGSSILRLPTTIDLKLLYSSSLSLLLD